MIKFLKSIFGDKPSVNFKEMVQNGAIIVDVRSLGEYKNGHIKGAKNIPLPALNKELGNSLKKEPFLKEKVFITYCASGRRSGIAKSQMKNLGFQSVHNGGGLQALSAKLKQ